MIFSTNFAKNRGQDTDCPKKSTTILDNSTIQPCCLAPLHI